MVEDKELDELEKSLPIVPKNDIASSNFADKMDEVKIEVLKTASKEDEKFVTTIKDNLKGAAVTHTEVEQEKASLTKQQVEFESDKLSAAQARVAHIAKEDKWENLRKKREYHYDGVKPIMQWIHVNSPMNLFFLYLVAVVTLPFFLLDIFCKATIGNLLAGASNQDRSKAVKGFLWTLIAVISVFAILIIVYLFLKWQGIDIFENFK